MTEADWLTATDPQPMLELLRGQASDRKLRLFAVACCLRLPNAHRGEGNRRVLEASEAYADGVIDFDELGRERERWFKFDSPFPLSGTWQAALSSVSMGNARVCAREATLHAARAKSRSEQRSQTKLLHDIFGNPFRPVVFDPAWRSESAVALASALYADRAFDRLPILADALEEAGCERSDILNHCRGPGPHVRGCWAVDLVLGKE